MIKQNSGTVQEGGMISVMLPLSSPEGTWQIKWPRWDLKWISTYLSTLCAFSQCVCLSTYRVMDPKIWTEALESPSTCDFNLESSCQVLAKWTLYIHTNLLLLYLTADSSLGMQTLAIARGFISPGT